MSKVHFEKGQAVTITWLDSASVSGWVYDDVPIQPKVIESLGYVVAVGDEAVALTAGRSDTGGVISPLCIPYCCIQAFKVLTT